MRYATKYRNAVGDNPPAPETTPPPYSVGTIKLTWIEPNNYKELNSQMFNSTSDALASLKDKKLGNNWLVFKLVKTDGVKYKWELLPYGKHRGYLWGMKLRDNPVLRYGSIALFLYGCYNFYLLMKEE
jgi:hypothetical protein